jgi:hypothetical protein
MVHAILRALGRGPDETLAKITKGRPVARVTYRADADRALRAWSRRRPGRP